MCYIVCNGVLSMQKEWLGRGEMDVRNDHEQNDDAPEIVGTSLNHNSITSTEIILWVLNAIEVVLQVGCWLVHEVNRCQLFQCLAITQARLVRMRSESEIVSGERKKRLSETECFNSLTLY